MVKTLVGVLDEPYSQLTTLSEVTVYTGPAVYTVWNRPHLM
jgi:hypothetical protein